MVLSILGPLLGVVVGSALTAWITHWQMSASFKAVVFQRHVEVIEEAAEALGAFFMLCINANPEGNPNFSRDRLAEEFPPIIMRWQNVMARLHLYFSGDLLAPALGARDAMIGWMHAVEKGDYAVMKDQWELFTSNRGWLMTKFREKMGADKLSDEIQKRFLKSA